MSEPLPETEARTVAVKARDAVVELAATRDAVALGPGLGLDEDTRRLSKQLLAARAALDELAGTGLPG